MSEAKLAGPVANRNQLDTEEIFRYVEAQVFDLRNPDSVAKRLERARGTTVVQTPIYVVARPVARLHAARHLVLRALK